VVRKKVLIQWIGHSDLRAMAASLSPAKQKTIVDSIKGPPPTAGDNGPTKTLLSSNSFDDVYLLSNYDSDWNKWFQGWLGTKTTVVPVKLGNPTEYSRIFEIADQQIRDLKSASDWGDSELCLHLSPGTPMMAAVWLLLGKTRHPATFYETSRDGKCWITDVPFDLVDVIPDVLRSADIRLQHLASEAPSQVEGFGDIIGTSSAIRDAVGRAKRAAVRSVSILLLGESGTGKDMFAQAIHKASPRRKERFKAINCAALSKTLLESELFGHAKGAFTDAKQDRAGAFETADKGTLFLDEIGECDLETQAKLLRVLQPSTKEGPAIRYVCRLGEEKDRRVDVRVIAATNRDLHKAIADGRFREDLYYRLAGVTITLPPLRERRSDIAAIAERLLGLINSQFQAEGSKEPGYVHKSLSVPGIDFVKGQAWPGNVRQLYNALVQAAVFADGNEIGRRELEAALGEMPDPSSAMASLTGMPLGDDFSLEKHLEAIEEAYLRKAMEEARGVKAQASRLLGIPHYQTLDGKLKRLGVPADWGKRA